MTSIQRPQALLKILLPAAGIAGMALWYSHGLAGERAVAVPPPAVDAPASGASDTAVFAGGCFWGMQAVFEHVNGVTRVIEGYSGGATENPSYEQVSTGETGHAESVEVTYDPGQISYGKLLQIYFSVAHDPTQLNRQGPDTGTQYRSAIFYANEAQKQVADAYIAQLDSAGVYGQPIVTEVKPLAEFYRAEDYHQDYFLNHPESLYIQFNDVPKVENLRSMFPELYRDDPVRVASAG
jgi:peptide-methionine (S)-S-oxide reductase